jgi:hypothetical protein
VCSDEFKTYDGVVKYILRKIKTNYPEGVKKEYT